MLELLNFGASILAGGGLTMASNGLNSVLNVFENLSQSREEAREKKHNRFLESHAATDKSQKDAREFQGPPGYHKTRQWIAKLVIFCYFVIPLSLPFIASLFGVPVMLSVGYFDIFQKWPWSESVEIVKWVTIGNPGGIPIVITPVMNNIALSIIGMFFGNQMTKR